MVVASYDGSHTYQISLGGTSGQKIVVNDQVISNHWI